MLRYLLAALALCLSTQAYAQGEDEEYGEGGGGGSWTFSGGAGLGPGYFSLGLNVGYFFNPYIGTQVSGAYISASGGGKQAERYRPETALVLRLVNPTMLTPFGGAGVGYEHWTLTERNEVFDESGSPTAVYFAGVAVAFSKNASLNVQNTWRTYLDHAPRRFGDHSQREESTQDELSIGIVFSF